MKYKLLLAALAVASNTSWADPVVITNAGLTLQPSEVHDVFMGHKQFAGSQKLILVDNSQTQEKFLSEVLKSDPGKYRSVWARKAFQDGVAPPQTRGTDAEVIEFVKRTPGAVSYVSTDPGKVGVNVVGK